MSKNRVILEFFYKISELSELLYLVILVLRRDVGRAVRYDVYLFCLAMLAPALCNEIEFIDASNYHENVTYHWKRIFELFKNL